MSDNALISALQGASNAAASNVSGPVDMLAWALRKAGVPVPSNPIMGSEWMRQKGLLAEPQNKLAGLLGEGAGLAAPVLMVTRAPQIARGLLGADDALTAGANKMADHFQRTGAAYRYDPKQRGAFMGANSKTWDAASNAKALQLEAAGTDPRTIWKETGNWKGPDGKWRQEINDRPAVFNPEPMKTVPGTSEKVPTAELGGYLQHPSLYKAYPELKGQLVEATSGSGGAASGGYSHGADYPFQIWYGKQEGAKPVLAHEIQHAIQQTEGFASGGSPQMMARSKEVADASLITAKVNKELEKLARKTVKQGYRTAADDALYLKLQDAKLANGFGPDEAYMRLAGEAEARAVEARINMTDAQRRATFPADSYDRPLSQLIVRGWDGENLSPNALVNALKGPR